MSDNTKAADNRACQAATESWQQTKSRQTRQAILQAAVDCFFERGYSNTSTEHIAKKAALSRGAMLHHFPTRADLISATVQYLNTKRLEMYRTAEQAAQAGAQYTRVEEGIESYWQQLNTPTFIVFRELQVAARTDAELAKVLQPALAEYRSAVMAQSKALFPDLALSEAFERANFLSRYLLEGMAIAHATESGAGHEDILLPWLKRELRRSFQDVLGSVKRNQTPSSPSAEPTT